MSKMMTAIGLDIGGTEVKGSVIREDGVVLHTYAETTECSAGRDGIWASVYSVLDGLLDSDSDVVGIGVGTAGRVNPATGEVVYATDNLPGWQGVNVILEIESRYQRPCLVDNDANAALAGEIWRNAALSRMSVTMLTLGTGVGGANAVHGKIVQGHHYQGGEWGHMVMVPDGRPCNCGLRGCLEQYLSGTALLDLTNEHLAEQNAAITYTHGRDIFEAFRAGNEAVRPVVDTYMKHLALAIHNISVSLDPEAVLIGGGVIHSKEIWWDLLQRRLKEYQVKPRVIPARLGNRAGMFGAAKLALQGHETRRESRCEGTR